MVRAAKEIQPDDEILMPYGSEYWKGDGGSIIGLQDSDGEHSDEGEDPGEGDEDPAEDPEIPAIDLVSEDTSHPFASESEGDDSDPDTILDFTVKPRKRLETESQSSARKKRKYLDADDEDEVEEVKGKADESEVEEDKAAEAQKHKKTKRKSKPKPKSPTEEEQPEVEKKHTERVTPGKPNNLKSKRSVKSSKTSRSGTTLSPPASPLRSKSPVSGSKPSASKPSASKPSAKKPSASKPSSGTMQVQSTPRTLKVTVVGDVFDVLDEKPTEWRSPTKGNVSLLQNKDLTMRQYDTVEFYRGRFIGGNAPVAKAHFLRSYIVPKSLISPKYSNGLIVHVEAGCFGVDYQVFEFPVQVAAKGTTKKNYAILKPVHISASTTKPSSITKPSSTTMGPGKTKKYKGSSIPQPEFEEQEQKSTSKKGTRVGKKSSETVKGIRIPQPVVEVFSSDSSSSSDSTDSSSSSEEDNPVSSATQVD
jgi:hypothetical protein